MLRRAWNWTAGAEATVRRRLIACMAAAFTALIIVAICSAWLIRGTIRRAVSVNHTYQVELAVGNARAAIEQTEATRRGYLLSGDEAFLDAYRRFITTVPPKLAVLQQLTIENPGQQIRIAMLRQRIADLIEHRERSIALVRAGNGRAAVEAFVAEASSQRLRLIRDTFDAMTEEEQRLLVLRDDELGRSREMFLSLLGLAGVLLVVVAGLSLATVLRYTRDLNRASDRLAALNSGLEDEVRLRTADLTRANEELQRFTYIVSHDLRSPLVNVMGFTSELDASARAVGELIDRVKAEAPQLATAEAEQAMREDLPEAIGFIRVATAKMDRLINAILKLSREGRRVLNPEPIDMTALAAGIRGSLSHVAEEQGISIAIDPLPALIGDRVAIEQIFSNLIENAIKYGEPGRPGRVTVSGHREGRRVIYDVADNGRGIDPKDHARVFDLFRRSGRQDTAGEGIGLAHALALAIRMGGMITVQSALGQGATFRVSLPEAYDEKAAV